MAEDPKDEPEMLEETYRPDGLDTEWWYQFVQYRAHKVRGKDGGGGSKEQGLGAMCLLWRRWC